MIEIISSGPLSTIQDLGRVGVMNSGFMQCGAMDKYSLQLANRLVGNVRGAGAIEMTLVGLTARFTKNSIIALCGADMNAKINGRKIEINRAYEIKTNQTLECSIATNGMRTYLAVSGGIKGDIYLGSASTDLKTKTGGHFGRKLKAGDSLELTDFNLPLDDISKAFVKREKKQNVARVVLGPQDDMFTSEDIELFLSQNYTATAESDRMGIRLNGEPLKSKGTVDIISDGIVFGSVQIPKSGLPIILMADHQTTGGYAKIATVISTDLKVLAQLAPNDIIRFEKISQNDAEKLYIKEKKYFDNLIF